jgi:D-alanine--poly(phosphoribitol) ligase subunit 1
LTPQALPEVRSFLFGGEGYPIGGELWIGGPRVGLGYYANPRETTARFRQDPRQDQSQDRHRAIYYRSGDYVREDDQGRLWFQGRVDNQVKIRGHRIELEEIALAVQSIADV